MKMKMTTDNIKTLDDLHRRKVALRRKMNVAVAALIHVPDEFNL